jgi:hypothetical protein
MVDTEIELKESFNRLRINFEKGEALVLQGLLGPSGVHSHRTGFFPEL